MLHTEVANVCVIALRPVYPSGVGVLYGHPFHIVCMQETLSPYVCHDQFRA